MQHLPRLWGCVYPCYLSLSGGLVALMLCCLCHRHAASSLSCCLPRPCGHAMLFCHGHAAMLCHLATAMRPCYAILPRPCGHAMLSCHGHAAMLCYLATARRPCHGRAVLPNHGHAMLSCHYLAMWPRFSHAMLPGQRQAALLCCSLAAQSPSGCPVAVMLRRHGRVALPPCHC